MRDSLRVVVLFIVYLIPFLLTVAYFGLENYALWMYLDYTMVWTWIPTGAAFTVAFVGVVWVTFVSVFLAEYIMGIRENVK